MLISVVSYQIPENPDVQTQVRLAKLVEYISKVLKSFGVDPVRIIHHHMDLPGTEKENLHVISVGKGTKDYIAFPILRPDLWKAGCTEDEAVGKLIMSHLNGQAVRVFRTSTLFDKKDES